VFIGEILANMTQVSDVAPGPRLFGGGFSFFFLDKNCTIEEQLYTILWTCKEWLINIQKIWYENRKETIKRAKEPDTLFVLSTNHWRFRDYFVYQLSTIHPDILNKNGSHVDCNWGTSANFPLVFFTILVFGLPYKLVSAIYCRSENPVFTFYTPIFRWDVLWYSVVHLPWTL
jgi:hypothetical protein